MTYIVHQSHREIGLKTIGFHQKYSLALGKSLLPSIMLGDRSTSRSLTGADSAPPPLWAHFLLRASRCALFVGVLGASIFSLAVRRGLSGNTNSPQHSRPHQVNKSLPPCGCIFESELWMTRSRMNFKRSAAVMTSSVASSPAIRLVVNRPPEFFSIEFSVPVAAVMTMMAGCLSSSAGFRSPLEMQDR